MPTMTAKRQCIPVLPITACRVDFTGKLSCHSNRSQSEIIFFLFAKKSKKVILIKFPRLQLLRILLEKRQARLGISQGKSSVPDTHYFRSSFDDFMAAKRPWSANIVISHAAKSFQLIGKSKRVQLINQDIIVFRKSLVKDIAEHQLVIAVNALEELRGERGTCRIIGHKRFNIQPLWNQIKNGIISKQPFRLFQSNSLIPVKHRTIHRNNYCDFHEWLRLSFIPSETGIPTEKASRLLCRRRLFIIPYSSGSSLFNISSTYVGNAKDAAWSFGL